MQNNADALDLYLHNGGFPQFLKQGDESILENLLSDIIYRDIAVRHNIKDVRALQNLLIYLITNISNPVSANKLTNTIQVKTAKTILEY